LGARKDIVDGKEDYDGFDDLTTLHHIAETLAWFYKFSVFRTFCDCLKMSGVLYASRAGCIKHLACGNAQKPAPMIA